MGFPQKVNEDNDFSLNLNSNQDIEKINSNDFPIMNKGNEVPYDLNNDKMENFNINEVSQIENNYQNNNFYETNILSNRSKILFKLSNYL